MLNTKRTEALGLRKLHDGTYKLKGIHATITIENTTKYPDILEKVYLKGFETDNFVMNREIRCLKNKHRNELGYTISIALTIIVVLAIRLIFT